MIGPIHFEGESRMSSVRIDGLPSEATSIFDPSSLQSGGPMFDSQVHVDLDCVSENKYTPFKADMRVKMGSSGANAATHDRIGSLRPRAQDLGLRMLPQART